MELEECADALPPSKYADDIEQMDQSMLAVDMTTTSMMTTMLMTTMSVKKNEAFSICPIQYFCNQIPSSRVDVLEFKYSKIMMS